MNSTSSISELLQNKNLNSINVNVNNKYITNVNNVKRIALKLSDTLNDQHSFKFYCKVAWSLSESEIYSNLEQAMTGRMPSKYFTWLCQRSMSTR